MCVGGRRKKPAPAPTPTPKPTTPVKPPATTPVKAAGPAPSPAAPVLSAASENSEGVTKAANARRKKKGKKPFKIDKKKGQEIGGVGSGSGLGLNIPKN